jgi:serine protease inhibitor
MDSIDFLTSDFVSEETRDYFLELKEELSRHNCAERSWNKFQEEEREKLVNQAIELGLLDSLECEFLEDDTIADLIHDFLYYLANPAE